MLGATPTRARDLAQAGILLALLAAGAVGLRWQPAASVRSPLSADDVVHRMVAMNAERTAALHAYTAVRNYHLEYHGLSDETADMKVQVSYREPAPKRFTVISESGSSMLRHHVLEPLVRGERKEAIIEDHEGSALAPENYAFRLVDFPHAPTQDSYVLAVTPLKDRTRFVFRGKIWVNAIDFAIERVEGHSVKAPSWWVSHFDFQYQSQKIGDFWLPATSVWISRIRWFGHAVLDITDQEIALLSADPVNAGILEGMPQ